MNEELYNKIVKLINVLKDANSSNCIVIICTIISCVISILALGISLYLAYTQVKEKIIRKKVTRYIYSFFAPTYMIDRLPIINENKDKNIYNDIVDDLKNKDFLSNNDYNKVRMKTVMKKVEIVDEKEQDDDFDIRM